MDFSSLNAWQLNLIMQTPEQVSSLESKYALISFLLIILADDAIRNKFWLLHTKYFYVALGAFPQKNL